MAISAEAPPQPRGEPRSPHLRAIPRAWRLRVAIVAAGVCALLVIALVVTIERPAEAPPAPAATQPIAPAVAAPAPPSAASAPAASAPAAPAPLTPGELTQALQRSAVASNALNLQMTYAPPVFFEVTGKPAPADPNTLVFYLQEDTHIDALEARPPHFTLAIDGQGQYVFTSGEILSDSGHHRLSSFTFAQPDLPQPQHALTVTFQLANGTTTTIDWLLPIMLPNGTSFGGAVAPADSATAPAPAEAGATPATDAITLPDEALSSMELVSLNATLRRVHNDVVVNGSTISEVDVTYATPEYFRAALSPQAAARFSPDQAAVFLVSETSHTGELPPSTLPIGLTYQGVSYQPDLVEPTVSSSHHRVSLVRFPVNPQASKLLGKLDVHLPDSTDLSWGLPVIYTRAAASSPLGFSAASILSLVGGMLAAMWPCLFQLTVFFIPALAGVSMEEAASTSGAGARRWHVIRAALFFILGFTIVYTMAGALVGYLVQQFGNAPQFETAQRYIGIVAGLAIIVLALRTAAKVRAPIVCKMPVLSRMAHGRKASSPIELMVAGLAFATGCMTCFGAALIIAMVVYVGMSGSAVVGALTLFLFSMGMGVPLVIAAAAMGRVMPLLTRLERITPWMGLASSLVMVGFAIMLMTGNYMAFSAWLVEHL